MPVINRERVKARGTDEIVDYLLKFARALEDRMVNQIMNLFLQLFNEGVVYFRLPDSNGVYPEGTWRFIYLNNAIELQKMISGTWTKQAKWA